MAGPRSSGMSFISIIWYICVEYCIYTAYNGAICMDCIGSRSSYKQSWIELNESCPQPFSVYSYSCEKVLQVLNYWSVSVLIMRCTEMTRTPPPPFFFKPVMQPCGNPKETMLLWLTDLDHMFVFTFAFTLQLINHPFIPGNAGTFSPITHCLVKGSSSWNPNWKYSCNKTYIESLIL